MATQVRSRVYDPGQVPGTIFSLLVRVGEVSQASATLGVAAAGIWLHETEVSAGKLDNRRLVVYYLDKLHGRIPVAAQIARRPGTPEGIGVGTSAWNFDFSKLYGRIGIAVIGGGRVGGRRNPVAEYGDITRYTTQYGGCRIFYPDDLLVPTDISAAVGGYPFPFKGVRVRAGTIDFSLGKGRDRIAVAVVAGAQVGCYRYVRTGDVYIGRGVQPLGCLTILNGDDLHFGTGVSAGVTGRPGTRDGITAGATASFQLRELQYRGGVAVIRCCWVGL